MKGNLMITFLWGVIVVVVGLALGAALQLLLEGLMRTADRVIDATALSSEDDSVSPHRWQVVRMVLALFTSLSLVFVILAAVPFGWGAISLLLIDQLGLGVASVYIGLVLFRLVRQPAKI